jgi:hypothetical protein
MIFKRVEDLKLWQQAGEFSNAVIAILERPAIARDEKLRNQLSEAADSIVTTAD